MQPPICQSFRLRHKGRQGCQGDPDFDVDHYFLELLRYIHLNPVRAGLVRAPQDYRWSSHRSYLGLRTQSWLTTDFALSLFARERNAAVQAYAAFVNERIGAPRDDSLFEGCFSEPRVLGSDRFVESLSVPSESKSTKITLEQLAREVCAEFGVALEDVRSIAQTRPLATVRGVIASRAHDARIATFSDVARFLKRSVSAITRAAVRHAE